MIKMYKLNKDIKPEMQKKVLPIRFKRYLRGFADYAYK